MDTQKPLCVVCIWHEQLGLEANEYEAVTPREPLSSRICNVHYQCLGLEEP